MKRRYSLVFIGPVGTRSGYGAHARDIFHSLYDMDKFDIHVLDTVWGDTPRNALDVNNPKDKIILGSFLKRPLDKQPDIGVDVRLPQEYEKPGKYNIGITAGVETSAVSHAFLQGANDVDLNIVPSQHSKEGFVQAKFDKMKQTPQGQQQKVGELILEKPMEVLFEGVDENIYKPLSENELSTDIKHKMDSIKEDFCYLFVGQWLKGGFGEDRKDIGRMIKVFLETFAGMDNPPALVMKTSGAGFSVLDKEECLDKIKQVKSKFPSIISLPNIYLLHGSLSDEEINELYNHPKVKSMISFTHGEGFGRPLLEATMVGLPVIASGWSGQLDFLDPNKSLLISGSLNKVPESVVWENIIIPESEWFTVDESSAGRMLQHVYNNYKSVKSNAIKLMKINREKFTINKMTESLEKLIQPIIDKLDNEPVSVELKLPKLQKSSNIPEVKLPQLEKVGV
jgi:glycosyltransferase involved in cell wall biosynthesis